ncbi:MAG: WG repeat-containing protein [Bacillus subtilis]|nr:WG repeat-containing protein [Bacillus subtilis]
MKVSPTFALARKWGYIEKSGEIAIPTTYDDAYSFNEHGLALVEVGDLFKVINKKNQIIVDGYDDITDVGNFFVCKQGTNVFFVNLKGVRVSDVNYEDGGPFDGGFFGFANYSPDELYVFNAKGKQVLAITSQADMDDSNDFFVIDDELWVLLIRDDKLELINGKPADTLTFDGDDIVDVYNKLVVVARRRKTGVVNFKDEHIVEFLYDAITLFGDDYILVRLGTFYGILNHKGQTIVEPTKYTACQTALNP